MAKMSKNQILRTLVNERLTAAADEIFTLFEMAMETYENELRHFKEENQRKQQLLDSANANANANTANKAGVVHQQQQPTEAAGGVQVGLDPNQEITKVVIKEEPEEQEVKHEGEEEMPESVPESSGATSWVKGEEEAGSSFQHGQNEYRKPPFSCTANQMDMAPAENSFNQLLLKYQLAQESSTSAFQGDESTSNDGFESKKHQCSVCTKTFTRKQHLDLHMRVHSGEKPYSCTICSRTFALKGTLEVHMRTHTGERPYSCSICKKTFTQTSALTSHKRTHTGEKPYSCPMCKKTFGQKVHLEVHMRTHTGERPFCCSFCDKPFADSYNLKIHMRVHTGEKPYKCSVCQKGFTVSSNLRAHERTHNVQQ